MFCGGSDIGDRSNVCGEASAVLGCAETGG